MSIASISGPFVTDIQDEYRDRMYLPSPEEIRSQCAEIQKEWTEAERARRAGGQARRTRQPCVPARPVARLLIEFADPDGWAA